VWLERGREQADPNYTGTPGEDKQRENRWVNSESIMVHDVHRGCSNDVAVM